MKIQGPWFQRNSTQPTFQVYNVIKNDNIVSNLHVTWNINFIVVVMVKGIMSYNKDALTAAFSLACLEIRSRNEEVIILLETGFTL